jgi:hypothetical protein
MIDQPDTSAAEHDNYQQAAEDRDVREKMIRFSDKVRS